MSRLYKKQRLTVWAKDITTDWLKYQKMLSKDKEVAEHLLIYHLLPS